MSLVNMSMFDIYLHNKLQIFILAALVKREYGWDLMNSLNL